MLFVPSDGVFVKPPEDGLAAIDLFMCKVKHSAKLRSLFLYASRGAWKRAPALIPIVKKKKYACRYFNINLLLFVYLFLCMPQDISIDHNRVLYFKKFEQFIRK